MHLHTGTHAVQQLLGMQVNMDTIFTTWLTALIVFLVVFAASRGKKLRPEANPAMRRPMNKLSLPVSVQKRYIFLRNRKKAA